MTLVSTVQARAAVVNLVIEQGADFTHIVGLQNSDGSIYVLTGYDARMQIRPTIASATILLSCTVGNGRLVINGAAGQVTIKISNVDTTAMLWRSAVYDLEIISSGGIVTRIMQGNATVNLEVTR
jgi:hypothetical protein